jgi:aryl-alcohol dehydrogenase-like predicted oxidoreductase
MRRRWVLSHPLVTSAVIGATTEQQLQELMHAARQPPLSDQLRSEIDAIHAAYPNPTP